MLKSIYLQGGILGAVAVFVVGCVSHVPTETAPIASSSPTASSTSPSLPPKPEPFAHLLQITVFHSLLHQATLKVIQFEQQVATQL